MDDRASIYLDTISLASDFPGVAGNRKSISMSRQTIYHSAEDLGQSASSLPPAAFAAAAAAPTIEEAVPPRGATTTADVGAFLTQLRNAGAMDASAATKAAQRMNGGKRNGGGGLKGSSASDRNGGFDSFDAADRIFAATATASSAAAGADHNNDSSQPHRNDEVSAHALLGNSNKTVTYTEWKKRVNSFSISHSLSISWHGTEIQNSVPVYVLCGLWFVFVFCDKFVHDFAMNSCLNLITL